MCQVSKLNPLKMGQCWGDEEFVGKMCKAPQGVQIKGAWVLG